MKFNFFIYQSSSTDKDSHDQGMKRCCIDICMWSNIYLNVPTWSRCYFKLRVKQMLYVVCLWVCLPAYGPNQRLPLVSCTVAAQNRMYTLRKGSSHFHLPFPVWNVYTQTCTHTHIHTHNQNAPTHNRGSYWLLLSGVLHVDGEVVAHVVGRAHDHGNPLVDVHGRDVQNVLGARGGHAPCLHHDVGHGVALVQQPQLQGQWNTEERLRTCSRKY